MSKNNVVKLETKKETKGNSKLTKAEKSLANVELDLDKLMKYYKENECEMVAYVRAKKEYSGFEYVFGEIVFDKRVTDQMLRVYLCLLFYRNDNPNRNGITEKEREEGIAYPTQEQIAERLDVSLSKVKRQLAKLVELNYIVVINDNKKIHDSNRYRINALVKTALSKENRELKARLKQANEEQNQQQKEIERLKKELELAQQKNS